MAIAAHLGTGTVFDEAMASFAESYADQNERDYTALQEAVAAGRIVAETEICGRCLRRGPRTAAGSPW